MRELCLSIRGYLVGPIWWPVGAECYKPLAYDVRAEQARTTGKMTLRDHVLRATLDGDFSFSQIAEGELVAELVTRTATSVKRRTRCFPLAMFPSVADCRNDDWPGPECDD